MSSSDRGSLFSPLPEPYYQDDFVTLYHGDCRNIVPLLPRVSLLATDPPYGIASTWKGGSGHGWGKAREEGVLRNEWDAEPPSDEDLAALIDHADDALVWGGNYFTLPPARGWLVWNKPERGFTLSEAELAWTTRENVIRVFDANRSDAGREHPTQKPLSLMRWCIGLFPDAETVLDPFAGSGTTLRAAKDLGKHAIGVEIEERYCALAARRMGQEVLDFVTEDAA